MNQGDDWKGIVFRGIDYLLCSYMDIYRIRMFRIGTARIKIRKDWFLKTALLSLSEEVREDPEVFKDAVSRTASDYFLEDVIGEDNMVRIKGCFHSKEEISLFYLRCLWIYHNLLEEEWQEWFAAYFIGIPYCHDFFKGMVDEEEKKALLELLVKPFPYAKKSDEDAEEEIQRVQTIAEEARERAVRYLHIYAQILYPATDIYDKWSMPREEDEPFEEMFRTLLK